MKFQAYQDSHKFVFVWTNDWTKKYCFLKVCVQVLESLLNFPIEMFFST